MRSPCLRTPEGHWYDRSSSQGRGPSGDQTPLQQNSPPVTILCLHTTSLSPAAGATTLDSVPQATPLHKRQPDLVISPETTLTVKPGEMLSWHGQLTACPATRLCGATGSQSEAPGVSGAQPKGSVVWHSEGAPASTLKPQDSILSRCPW